MKTILILEDEPFLMTLLQRVLNRYGYATLEAGNSEEALRRFIENRRQIDLLLADVTVSGVSGVNVALLLRTELPGLNVILTSGYPSSAWNARNSADLQRLGSDSVGILPKPFSPERLLKAIRELIGAAQSEPLRESSV